MPPIATEVLESIVKAPEASISNVVALKSTAEAFTAPIFMPVEAFMLMLVAEEEPTLIARAPAVPILIAWATLFEPIEMVPVLFSSDKLFELNIISTDSFTGEIGEYVACRHFKLLKSERVTRAVDGVCPLGKKYQVKSKIVVGNNFNYNITDLETASFDYLVIVYFDRN